MRTTVDETGRIQLPERLRQQLCLKPGDVVILEEQAGHWLIIPSRGGQGLSWEGDILVHHGHSTGSIEQTSIEIRKERLRQLHDGLSG